jgi:hypothetical protein
MTTAINLTHILQAHRIASGILSQVTGMRKQYCDGLLDVKKNPYITISSNGGGVFELKIDEAPNGAARAVVYFFTFQEVKGKLECVKLEQHVAGELFRENLCCTKCNGRSGKLPEWDLRGRCPDCVKPIKTAREHTVLE